MPRRNRVTPQGDLIAVADRGLVWGNRGRLHDDHGRIVRYATGRAWIICVLEFKGRHRQLMAPGRLTELFFLDEATALAAGHRPCAQCRAVDHRAFKAAWAGAHPDDDLTAPAIDARLDGDRLVARGIRRTYEARPGDFPDNTAVSLDGRVWLLSGAEMLAWTPAGYGDRRRRPVRGTVDVVTPRATVAVLDSGYELILHPTAGGSATVR